jgi:transcriptional regulator with XRE-family HTH domain
MKRFSGRKLKDILDERNITQAQLADKLDLAASTVSTWIKDKSVPEFNNVIKLSEALGVESEDLMEEPSTEKIIMGDSNNSNVFMNNYGSVQFASLATSDVVFLDAPVSDPLIMAMKIDQETLSKVIRQSRKEKIKPGQFLLKVIQNSLQDE